ncbi:MAG: ABC transporter substrate-binding protein [Burkholderiales bacterium]|nr:ABC transporter substrate-binding protein [Burkholderiales bacterium]
MSSHSARRRFLATSLASAALAAAPALRAQGAPTRVRFQLDWRFDGQAAPFILGRAKGYFAQEGLDVHFDSGTGSAAAVARLAGGNYEMGYGDTSTLIEYMANNPNTRLQAVYMVLDSTPAGAMVLKKSNVTRPGELAGKTLGAPVFDAGRKLWPLFARAQGLDPGVVKWQSMEPPLREPMLLRGQVDGVTGFMPSSMLSALAAGAKEDDLRVFLYKDHGVRVYGNAILATSRFIEQNPRAVAGFLRAFNRALMDTISNPEEAIRFVKEREPLVDAALELRRLRAFLDNFVITATTRADGVGAISKLRLDHQVDDVARAFGLKTPPSSDVIFNSSFLPPRGERSFPAAVLASR